MIFKGKIFLDISDCSFGNGGVVVELGLLYTGTSLTLYSGLAVTLYAGLALA